MAEKCWEHYRSCPYNDDGWYCLHHGDVCDTWAFLQDEKRKMDAHGMTQVKYKIEIVFGRPIDATHKVIFEGRADDEGIAVNNANAEFGVKFIHQHNNTYIYCISDNTSILLTISN